LNALGIENTLSGNLCIVRFLLAALGLCWYKKSAKFSPLFVFICSVSLLWSYHGGYDFVILLPVFLYIFDKTVDDIRQKQRIASGILCLEILAYSLVSLALWTPILLGRFFTLPYPSMGRAIWDCGNI
jgi:hypothetical protein